MARTPNTINTIPAVSELDEGRLQEAELATQELGTLQASMNDAIATAHDDLGKAKMAMAFEEFSRTVRISNLAATKESKAYKHMIFPARAEFPNTWEGYCRLLGKSVDQVDRDIANLQAFGEEALESLQRIGIGHRDLTKFRRLPEDQKTLLIQAAKSGDKDSLLEYAQTLISTHDKEKTSLEKSLTSTKADLVAAEKVSRGHVEKINELTRQVVKFDVDIDLPAAFIDARQKATDSVNLILTELNRLEAIRDQAWDKLLPADEHGKEVHLAALKDLGKCMSGGFVLVSNKLNDTLEAFNDTVERLLAD